MLIYWYFLFKIYAFYFYILLIQNKLFLIDNVASKIMENVYMYLLLDYYYKLIDNNNWLTNGLTN